MQARARPTPGPGSRRPCAGSRWSSAAVAAHAARGTAGPKSCSRAPRRSGAAGRGPPPWWAALGAPPTACARRARPSRPPGLTGCGLQAGARGPRARAQGRGRAGAPRDLGPGPHGEHAGEERHRVGRVHGSRVARDARLVAEDQRAPEPGVLDPAPGGPQARRRPRMPVFRRRPRMPVFRHWHALPACMYRRRPRA